MSNYVKPWEVQPGDKVVGFPGRIVTSASYAGEVPYGGSAERQRYVVTLDDGKAIPYTGESKVHVIRG